LGATLAKLGDESNEMVTAFELEFALSPVELCAAGLVPPDTVSESRYARAAPPLFRKNATGAAISREQELVLWPIVSASSN
jgi:hypothetical protein